MRPELVELLRCPVSGQRLTLDAMVTNGGIVESGELVTTDGIRRYPIRDSVPRFVPESNYSDSFDLQWNKFRLTQLDTHSGHPISANRFWKATQWSPRDPTMVLPKYWLRPFTKRVPKQQLFASLDRLVPRLLPLSRGVARVPVAGRFLRRVVPVANYDGTLPLDERQLRKWALLDTFDWLSPAFDQPQRASTVQHWLTAAGLEDVEVGKGGHLVGRGTAPGPSRDQ